MNKGRKNKALAATLSLFPGAGHLYLGLQTRGLQIMAGFLASVYLMDALRLSMFLFLMPLFWFFAFFDVMRQLSSEPQEGLKDQAIITQFAPYQRWIGIALLLIGLYFMGDRVLAEYAANYIPRWYAQYQNIKYNLPTALVAFVMIAAGLRMAFGRGFQRNKGLPLRIGNRRNRCGRGRANEAVACRHAFDGRYLIIDGGRCSGLHLERDRGIQYAAMGGAACFYFARCGSFIVHLVCGKRADDAALRLDQPIYRWNDRELQPCDGGADLYGDIGRA